MCFESEQALRRVYLSHRFDAVGAFVGQGSEEFGDGFSEDRVAQVRCDFGQRCEDEAALCESGVREREGGRMHDEVVDQQQVQVERAGTVGRARPAITAVAAFRGEEQVKQSFGGKFGLKCNSRVNKCGLGGKTDGFCTVQRGASKELTGDAEVGNGGQEGLLGLAGGRGQVGAESDSGNPGGERAHKATLIEFGRRRFEFRRWRCSRLSSKSMKVGFFGGSFDPPHRGHVALAQLAMECVALKRVLFAPVGLQPLKRDRAQASFADRVAMTKLAIAGEPGLELSEIDTPRSDGRPNYTIDTVRALKETLAKDDQLFFLMGADSFLSIGKWHRASDLLVTCHFIVGSRPGFDLGRIAAALPASISVGSCDTTQTENLVLCLHGAEQGESRLYLLPDLSELASATGIRASLQRGAEPRWDLDPAVAAYIREHGLYRDSRAS